MNVLTFDIEDWFHLLDFPATRSEASWSHFTSRIHESVDRILHTLVELRQKATFFCLGWVADRYPEIIRKIDALGFEIGSHSYSHQLAYEQTPQTFASDLTRSMWAIEDLTGKKVRAYRAPGFSFTPRNLWVFEILIKNGIELDSSIFPASRGHGGFSKFGQGEPVIIENQGLRIKEFPISFAHVAGRRIIYSGGGYFRLFPYWLIQHWLRLSPYTMTYFHPRDFDPDQPRLEGLGWLRRFKSYHGLESALGKLKLMLSAFEFVDLDILDRSINWSVRPIVAL